MPSIEQAIQQLTFKSSLHRAQVNIVYTSAWLNQMTAKTLKPFGLSLQQFNILRILRGRAGKPATIKLLTERMLDKMSNASRLVDKLKEKELVDRQECPTDRRQVDIVITRSGLDLIQRASDAAEGKRSKVFQRISDDEAATLRLSLIHI